MPTLTTPRRCFNCNEMIPAGAAVVWEELRVPRAHGDYRRYHARSVVRHEGYCPALRVEDLNEALSKARAHHEIARSLLYVIHESDRSTVAKASARERLPAAFADARKYIAAVRRYRTLVSIPTP